MKSHQIIRLIHLTQIYHNSGEYSIIECLECLAYFLVPIFKPYLAIAAFVSVLILISYTALKLLRSNDVNDRVPQISMQEFSESYLNDIEIITLEESGAALIQSEEVPYINHSDIIDYLLLENIPVNEIYELL